jgi:ribosome maturation factor RimP
MRVNEAKLEAVRRAVEPAIAALGLDLYDIEVLGGTGSAVVRVTITRESGVDLEAITAATQAVSPLVDDAEVVNGPFLLEVSSPGIERALRRPEHFHGAIGEEVSIKFHTADGPRRVHGRLVDVDVNDDRVTVELDDDGRTEIALADITQARTVFAWGQGPSGPSERKNASPRPGKAAARAKERS